MRAEVSFNINFDINEIVKQTGKSKEDFVEFIDKNLLEQVTNVLNYEFADGDAVTITNIKANNVIESQLKKLKQLTR